MAPELQPVKPLEDMMKNLKVNSSPEISEGNTVVSKDGNPSDATSCISSAGDATSSVKESDDQESLMTEQGMYYHDNSYYGYYYPGYDALYGEWGDRGYLLQYDGLEMQYPVIQPDGSVIYYMSGYQPGFSPYGSYVPGAMIGVDAQYIGQNPYLSSSLVSQPAHNSIGGLPSPVAYGADAVPIWPSDPSMFGDGNYTSGFTGTPTIAGSKPSFSSAPSHSHAPPTKSTPSKPTSSAADTKCFPPALHVPPNDAPGHTLKPFTKGAAVLPKGYYPIPKLSSFSNHGKGTLLYPDGRANWQSWAGDEKTKVAAKANVVGGFDLLNEQNRGPRTISAKSNWVAGTDLVGPPGESNGNNNSTSAVIRRDQYNLSDFPTKYEDALFFVIKSYSEDDIHKSIKYNVWASTPNGNKRLDTAYQDAVQRAIEKGSRCPVFLFFSVNASGQFCGVAEMIGRVDFTKNMDFWQQDKWNGFFPVKWHIIKDVPNPQFRHILLENNDNKPVTNSRDTQEVKFPQGIEMLNIFKSYSAKTSILDDFGFYESRQKAMLDKRIRAFTPNVEHIPATKLGDKKFVIAGHQAAELAASMKNKQGMQVDGHVKD